MPILVLFGGAAGAGKTTLARAWCATRERAAFVELDAVRDVVIGGRADPQDTTDPRQPGQHYLAAEATWQVARVYLDAGYDVAVEEVFPPGDYFESVWRPKLAGCDWRLVVIHPSLPETLRRSRERTKDVWEVHTRSHHAACTAWPDSVRVDTTRLNVHESLAAVSAKIDVPRPDGL